MARELWIERDGEPIISHWFPLDDIGEVKIVTRKCGPEVDDIEVNPRVIRPYRRESVQWVVLGVRKGEFNHRDGRAQWIELWAGEPFPSDEQANGAWGSEARDAARVAAVEAARNVVRNLGGTLISASILPVGALPGKAEQ